MLLSEYVEVREASISWMSQFEAEEPKGRAGASSEQERLVYSVPYGEPLSAARPKLVDFVSLRRDLAEP